jgi:DNA polymerase III subunit delta
MTPAAPVVFVLHGEDDFAIAQFVSQLEAELGDAATASMNITRLDGRNLDVNALPGAANAMPFLAKRRLVIVNKPLGGLSSQAARDKFKAVLEKVPPTTQLVVIEDRELTSDKERRAHKIHWLEKWASEQGGRVQVKSFPLPKRHEIVNWIQERARLAGGQMTPAAASLLASLVGDEPRQADQEIHKLLAYVNYVRPVEPDDVQAVTVDIGEGDVFAMVDALGSRDGRKAIGMLHRLMEAQDPFSLFGMIVRQFRLLLLAREIMDGGGRSLDVAQKLRVPPFVADKIIHQAKNFSLPVLEAVYHRLCDLDEGMKTSQISGDLALDTLIAAFTYQGN